MGLGVSGLGFRGLDFRETSFKKKGLRGLRVSIAMLLGGPFDLVSLLSIP